MGSVHGTSSATRQVRHFNPRSPGGERPINTLQSELDRVFQSALPRWGASTSAWIRKSHDIISIRAPQVGSVQRAHASRQVFRHFNPRSPGGERLDVLAVRLRALRISIRAPQVGSVVRQHAHDATHAKFQSALPRWGASLKNKLGGQIIDVFQSALPRWGASGGQNTVQGIQTISIRAPQVGSVIAGWIWLHSLNISIRAPQVGSVLRGDHGNVKLYNISIRAPQVGSVLVIRLLF